MNLSRRSFSPIYSLTLIGLALLSGGSAGCGSDELAITANDDDRTTTSTTPPSQGGSEVDSAELNAIAAQIGETPERTAAIIAAQGPLSEFANSVKSSDAFVDFMFTADHTGAVLVVEPGSSLKALAGGAAVPGNVTIQEAAAPRPVRADSLNYVREAARSLAGSSVDAVVYNAFTNEFTVWFVPGTKVDSRLLDIVDRATADGRALIGASIAIDVEQGGGLFRGGQWAHSSGGNNCTTGFGVISGSSSAYTTAGHCGTGTWTINGNTSSNVKSRSVGGYNDHEMIVAGGASWLVRISPSSTVDMEAVAYHIYMNGLYCNYGVYSNIQSCGYINAQNVPVKDGSTTIFTSQSSAVCTYGDSGGPVWAPTASRKPSGTIEGGDISVPPVNGNYKCRYIALDDQLAGTGWTLL